MIRASILIGLGLSAGIATGAEAVQYEAGETERLISTFDSVEQAQQQGWTLAGTSVNELGELFLPDGQDRFQAANFNLAAFDNLDLDNGAVSLYWRARWVNQRKANYTERAKFFVELDIIPQAIEDREIKMAVRPVGGANGNQDRYYHLYLDPGFEETHEVDSFLQVPGSYFNVLNTYKDFRLTVNKTGADRVEVSPFYWDNIGNRWVMFNLAAIDPTKPDYSSGESVPPPVPLSITNNLQGRDYFESLSFRFTNPEYSFLDSFAVTQQLSFTDPNPVTVPEPASIVGLLAIGAGALRGKHIEE